MTVLDSPLSKNVQATYCLDIGDFHFFDNFIVAEFKQGSYVSFKDFQEIFDLSQEYFNGRPSGFISNRVNSYSINLLDITENREKLSLLSAYAIVTYSHNTKRMLAMEDYYSESKRERFNSLMDAVKWMTKELVTIELNKFRQS